MKVTFLLLFSLLGVGSLNAAPASGFDRFGRSEFSFARIGGGQSWHTTGHWQTRSYYFVCRKHEPAKRVSAK